MSIQTKKTNQIGYTCYFCKDNIKSSSKTEILYRSAWIDGCCECFILSINKTTAAAFQQKEY